MYIPLKQDKLGAEVLICQVWKTISTQAHRVMTMPAQTIDAKYLRVISLNDSQNGTQ
jgi:hypothetical protein